MVLYEDSPVRQPITDLVPKLSDMADEDVQDCHRLATSFIGDDYDRVNSTDDNSSGKTLVSRLTLSQATLSLQRGDNYLRRFFGDDSSFMLLIFEELNMTTLHLQIQQDTEKHVLHKDH
jgi:hypothetical protein